MGLCLTRKIGEKIKIGDDIEIEVTKLSRGQVKLCIDAPPNLYIKRPEKIKKTIIPEGAYSDIL